MMMKILCALFSSIILIGYASAGELKEISNPSFEDIEPRLVYGEVVYDMTFRGNGPKQKTKSAREFLKNIVKSKFSNRKGNYILTIDLFHAGEKIASEPLVTANWNVRRFLYFKVSEETSYVINRKGVLADNFVVTNEANRMKVAINVFHSDATSLDISILKEISNLAKVASVARLAPGVAVISSAYQPFVQILDRLLSRYTARTIVDRTTGAFTLLHRGFANQFAFIDDKDRLQVNIYYKTVASQMKSAFRGRSGFRRNIEPELVLSTIKAGVGAARARVIDIIKNRDTPAAELLKTILVGRVYQGNDIGRKCKLLKKDLFDLVSTRDAKVAYWALMQAHGDTIRQNPNGLDCGNTSIRKELQTVGLELGDGWSQ